MGRFLQFVKAAGERGWPSMVGTFVFVAISVLEHYWDHNLAAYIFIVLAASIFCWGAFAAWSDADKKVVRLREEINARLPNIKIEMAAGYIDAGKSHEKEKWGDAEQGCLVSLYIIATNQNDQQAFLWGLPELICHINGQEHRGEWRHICSYLLSANDSTLKGDKRLVDFLDQSYVGAGFTGFTMFKGRPLAGWLMFYLSTLDKNIVLGRDELGCSLSLTLTDTLGGHHSVTEDVHLKVNLLCLTTDLLPTQPTT